MNVREAFKAAETAERYRIHDLTKNPDDLPERSEKVIVYYRYTDEKRTFTGHFIGVPVFCDGEIWQPDDKMQVLGWARFPRWEDEHESGRL